MQVWGRRGVSLWFVLSRRSRRILCETEGTHDLSLDSEPKPRSGRDWATVLGTLPVLLVPSIWVPLARFAERYPTRTSDIQKHENVLSWALSELLRRALMGRVPVSFWE